MVSTKNTELFTCRQDLKLNTFNHLIMNRLKYRRHKLEEMQCSNGYDLQPLECIKTNSYFTEIKRSQNESLMYFSISDFVSNYWQTCVDMDFFDRLRTIDWQAIFYRTINSDESQHLTLIQIITAIAKYGLFLSLIHRYQYMKVVPTQELDLVLHAHMLDTYKFKIDCQTLFGTRLNHIAGVGRGEAERQEWLKNFSYTCYLFEQNFGKGTMDNSIAACCEILLGGSMNTNSFKSMTFLIFG